MDCCSEFKAKHYNEIKISLKSWYYVMCAVFNFTFDIKNWITLYAHQRNPLLTIYYYEHRWEREILNNI